MEGFNLGFITGVDSGEATDGDAFVIAPDNSRLDRFGSYQTKIRSQKFALQSKTDGACGEFLFR